MDERDKILMAQDWVRKLANGINPLTGNAVKEDDVVNNVHISRGGFVGKTYREKIKI